MIRVLIPDLYNERRSQFLSQDEQRIFYEAGLRPAIERLQLERAAEWPATYNDEMFRARGVNGQLSFQTKIVPDWLLRELGDYLRESLEENGYSWGEGLVFLHQIRGVKHSTTHSTTARAASEALSKFLTSNSLPIILLNAPHSWWLDAALEFNSKAGNCVAWRTDSHYHVVRAVTGISEYQAQRITKPGSSKYTRDMTSHLTQVSGCRIAPGAQARGPYDIAYIQMYTTDKSLTFRQDQGRYGKFITCERILKGKATAYIDQLYELYTHAIDNNYSLARIEIRLPLRHGYRALVSLDGNLIYNSLVSVPTDFWW